MSATDIDNTSGQGPASRVPPEVRRWNWGAFLLNWIWGLGNNVLLALLVFVPLFGFVWMVVLGARGSEWAWRNRRWDSVAQFQAAQRRWARWGVGVLVGGVVLAGLGVLGIFGLLKDSEAYRLASARLAHDARVVAAVGEPLSTGLPSESIQVSGPDGAAHLSFSVTGPKGSGKAFVEARKSLGAWRLEHLVFEADATGQRTELVEPAEAPPGGAV